MNRQTAEKIRFFMTGMSGRISEAANGTPDGEQLTAGGAESFPITSISAEFKSGLKKYKLTAPVRPGEKLSFNFGGNTHSLDYAGFTDFICGAVPEYDELVLTYIDDYKESVILASGKDVSFRTSDRNLPKVNGTGGSFSASSGQNHELSGASMSNRAYFVKPDNPRATEMLKAIGIMGDNGKVKNDKIRKYNQIDHFIELIDPMLRKLCDAKKKQENGDKTIDIVDCACGKSYLSFALCYYVRFVLKTPCRFTGLDYNSIVIEDSKRIAEKLGYTNMKFIETDIGKYEPDRKYDLLITLHACDIATDLALRFGIDHGVKAMVCVPCCHREMNDQGYELGAADPVLKYGILKARIADSLTDGLRAMYLEAIGYDVSMVEYISPLDTPKNLMMRCELKRGYSQPLMDKYNGLCNSLGVKMSISKESDLIR
ncbi:MAG: SAM-dependent methyltransferase [Clostridia bacterium]|nr:SAM-dependent methyltransferase [Clostridia bacterium]